MKRESRGKWGRRESRGILQLVEGFSPRSSPPQSLFRPEAIDELIESRRHEGQGIDGNTVLPNLEMKVIPGGVTCAPYPKNGLPSPHRIPLLDQDDHPMSVNGAIAIIVFEHHGIPQSLPRTSRINDLSIRSRHHLLVGGGSDVNPSMNPSPSGTEMRGDAIDQRPDEALWIRWGSYLGRNLRSRGGRLFGEIRRQRDLPGVWLFIPLVNFGGAGQGLLFLGVFALQ
jgi:hypothetical protein